MSCLICFIDLIKTKRLVLLILATEMTEAGRKKRIILLREEITGQEEMTVENTMPKAAILRCQNESSGLCSFKGISLYQNWLL